MKNIIENNIHIIKIQKGEYVRQEIEKYVFKHQLGFCKLEAIGMLSEVKIGFLNDQGDYDWKTFDEGELVSFLGNVAWVDQKPAMHAHLTLGLSDYSVVGGHFGEAKVSGVVELFLMEVTKTKIERQNLNIVPFKTWAI